MSKYKWIGRFDYCGKHIVYVGFYENKKVTGKIMGDIIATSSPEIYTKKWAYKHMWGNGFKESTWPTDKNLTYYRVRNTYNRRNVKCKLRI